MQLMYESLRHGMQGEASRALFFSQKMGNMGDESALTDEVHAETADIWLTIETKEEEFDSLNGWKKWHLRSGKDWWVSQITIQYFEILEAALNIMFHLSEQELCAMIALPFFNINNISTLIEQGKAV